MFRTIESHVELILLFCNLESRVTLSAEDSNIEITLACCSKIAEGYLELAIYPVKLVYIS